MMLLQASRDSGEHSPQPLDVNEKNYLRLKLLRYANCPLSWEDGKIIVPHLCLLRELEDSQLGPISLFGRFMLNLPMQDSLATRPSDQGVYPRCHSCKRRGFRPVSAQTAFREILATWSWAMGDSWEEGIFPASLLRLWGRSQALDFRA